MATPQLTEVSLSRLERLLEFWAAMIEIERTILDYNDQAGDVVRHVGTEAMGERSYLIDTDTLDDQRRTLADAIAYVLRDERRQRALVQIGLPVKDDELAQQFQALWSAAGVDGDNVAGDLRGQEHKRYDPDQWRKFQQMLFKRGIVV